VPVQWGNSFSVITLNFPLFLPCFTLFIWALMSTVSSIYIMENENQTFHDGITYFLANSFLHIWKLIQTNISLTVSSITQIPWFSLIFLGISYFPDPFLFSLNSLIWQTPFSMFIFRLVLGVSFSCVSHGYT